jgi:hypothetical protein
VGRVVGDLLGGVGGGELSGEGHLLGAHEGDEVVVAAVRHRLAVQPALPARRWEGRRRKGPALPAVAQHLNENCTGLAQIAGQL